MCYIRYKWQTKADAERPLTHRRVRPVISASRAPDVLGSASSKGVSAKICKDIWKCSICLYMFNHVYMFLSWQRALDIDIYFRNYRLLGRAGRSLLNSNRSLLMHEINSQYFQKVPRTLHIWSRSRFFPCWNAEEQHTFSGLSSKTLVIFCWGTAAS